MFAFRLMNDSNDLNNLLVLRWAIIGCGNICKNFVKALGIANKNHQV